jgi:DMSO/TMAO reductase YedYZ molybdopterin-dependent catalytic subunit
MPISVIRRQIVKPADIRNMVGTSPKNFSVVGSKEYTLLEWLLASWQKRNAKMAGERRMITSGPENSETPLDIVRSWVTPTRLFFVRNHFNIPELNEQTWGLQIDGCVERPVEYGYDDLIAMPQRSVLATIECAGNGRSFLTKHVEGVQWGAGAIAHAEWSGVPLYLVLEQARLKPETVQIVFYGADQGTEGGHAEPIRFARSLPLSKALHPDTLLALHMNGEPLEPSHGFPVRLLVPGWYGVASVKWLTRMAAVKQPFEGFFQTYKYTLQRQAAEGTKTIGIESMAVKSEIIRPREDEILGLGAQRMFGLAWAGEESVARVEVSTDGGLSWSETELLGPHAPYSWTLWEYMWHPQRTGTYTLMSRAMSASGKLQPREHDPLNGGYLIHFSRPRRVQVGEKTPVVVLATAPDVMLYDMNAFAEANAIAPLDVEMEFSLGAGI